MTLATLTNSKISVIESNGATEIQFPNLETALSALVKYQWVMIAPLDSRTVLFQHSSDDVLQCVSQLRMAVHLVESIQAKRAIARLSVE